MEIIIIIIISPHVHESHSLNISIWIQWERHMQCADEMRCVCNAMRYIVQCILQQSRGNFLAHSSRPILCNVENDIIWFRRNMHMLQREWCEANFKAEIQIDLLLCLNFWFSYSQTFFLFLFSYWFVCQCSQLLNESDESQKVNGFLSYLFLYLLLFSNKKVK